MHKQILSPWDISTAISPMTRISEKRVKVTFFNMTFLVPSYDALINEPMIRFLTMVKALTSLVGMTFIPRNIP